MRKALFLHLETRRLQLRSLPEVQEEAMSDLNEAYLRLAGRNACDCGELIESNAKVCIYCAQDAKADQGDTDRKSEIEEKL